MGFTCVQPQAYGATVRSAEQMGISVVEAFPRIVDRMAGQCRVDQRLLLRLVQARYPQAGEADGRRPA